MKKLADYGATIVRLDAFAYAPKAPGRRNFLNDPETWELLESINQLVEPLGLTLLPEIHASYAEGIHRKLCSLGFLTYDFFLPGLLIDAIERADASYLVHWAQEILDLRLDVVNMLGCHDGIPLLDLKGLLPDKRIQELIDLIIRRGGMIKNLHGQKDVYYQVNATYYSALGEDDRKLLIARAIQLFMPGKPQVWYLDLFAGKNNRAAAMRDGTASHKEINRTNLSIDYIEAGIKKPIVRNQLELLRLCNNSPAFHKDADLTLSAEPDGTLEILWRRGCNEAKLFADFCTLEFQIDIKGNEAGSYKFNQHLT